MLGRRGSGVGRKYFQNQGDTQIQDVGNRTGSNEFLGLNVLTSDPIVMANVFNPST